MASLGDPARSQRPWFQGIEISMSCESEWRAQRGPHQAHEHREDNPKGTWVSELLLSFFPMSGRIWGPEHLGPYLCVSLVSVGFITRQIFMFRTEGRDSRLFLRWGHLVLWCHLPCYVLVMWRDVHPFSQISHFKFTLLQSKFTLEGEFEVDSLYFYGLHGGRARH